MPGLACIGVPIDSAGVAGGTSLGPRALRSQGLIEAIRGVDRGDLEVAIRGSTRDPLTGVLESAQVDAATVAIREAVAAELSTGNRPFLIGGCCAMVPGALAGCRDVVGDVGIIHLDGHLDLYDGATSPLGEAADMPLAVGLGFGPASWVAAAGGPSLAPERTWILGYRDRSEARADGMIMPEDFQPPVRCMSTHQMREMGPGLAVTAAVSDLARTAKGFWVHLDLDIVDPGLFYANDAPVDDGLDWDELVGALQAVIADPGLLGFSLGCYNPEKDPEGRNGIDVVEVFARAIGDGVGAV